MNNIQRPDLIAIGAVLCLALPTSVQAGESEFIFDNAPFASCHASTIAEAKGGLVAAWFGGTDEGHKDVGIWSSRLVQGNWTAPVEVASGVQKDGKRFPCWNPVLFQPKKGPLLLFYKVGTSPSVWWGMMRTSNDGGKSWSDGRRLPDGFLGPIKNKPVQLANGDILCPSSTETPGRPSTWRIHFERTSDLGKTWTKVEPAAATSGPAMNAIQPSILFHPGGTLEAIGRTREKRLFQTWSNDGGKAWSALAATDVPNPNSGIDAVTLRDGRQLLVYNPSERDRTPLAVAISTDGKLWRQAQVLEDDPDPEAEFSYPAVIQTSDGLVHITYTWKRKKVKHVVVDPAKLTALDRHSPANNSGRVIATGDTELRIEAGEDTLCVVGLRSLPSGRDWMVGAARAAPIALISSIEMDRQTLPVHWRLAEQSSHGDTTIIRFACKRPALELKSIWQAYRGPGPVEHTIQIVNHERREIVLPLQSTLAFSFAVPRGHAIDRWWVERGGSRPSDMGTHCDRVKPGTSSSLVSTPYGSDPIPWMSVQDVEGRRGWYAGIEFSGFVRMMLQAGEVGAANGLTARAVLGLGKSDADDIAYRTRLSPGATFETPTVFLGCYDGEVDDGSNRLRRWVERYLRPPSKANLPLLVNNSWGDGMAVDDAMMRRMIDVSARLGVEMAGVDAGWFRRVGDWRANPAKFPAGLSPLVDYAHSKGLLFGLWLAWTQGGDTYDPARPGEILSPRDPAMRNWFPSDMPSNWKNSDFTGATVCLGKPDAAEWCLKDVRRAVGEFKVDMLEHDQVMIVDHCVRGDHSHTPSPIDVAYAAARGYYRVQDGLRESFPHLLLENCCNGGNLIDYGIIRRTHYISITDTYDPLSNRRAFYDASYAIPPSMCECYVENRPGKTPANFLYMLRSGMMGWCTIMLDMARWSPAQQETARRQFELYKKTLRPLIQQADLYHVLERPDGRRWDGMEYYDGSTGRGVLFAFRGTTPQARHRFPLKGLDNKARYRLTFEDGSSAPVTATGRDLAETGVAVALAEPESSELVHLVRE